MPARIWRKPWTVAENCEEGGNSRTLVLQPVGHPGLSFAPGQFAWLITGGTPFHHEEHPISFSSPAEMGASRSQSFTIKALEDWSGTVVPKLQPGTRVRLDGPFGVFSPDRDQGPGYVLIGGGIGITPVYSMCLTMADRKDVRPVLLFHACRNCHELVLRSKIGGLRSRMDLRLVYLLEDPCPGWKGETGLVTAEILRRYLPDQYRRFQYFVCGPPPMMDAMEEILPALGIAPENIHTERFDFV